MFLKSFLILMSWAFLQGLTPAVWAQESQKPICSISSLTDDCRIFDELPAQIEFSDGTSVNNPFAPRSTESIADEAAESQQIQERRERQAQYERALVDAQINYQVEVIDLLRAAGFHERLQYALSSIDHAPVLGAMLRDVSTRTLSPFILPWPPSEPRAPAQAVTADQVREQIIEVLGEEGKERWFAAVEGFRAAQDIASIRDYAEVTKPSQPGVSAEDEARVQQLFLEARSHMLNMVLKGRTLAQLSAAERAIYDKIRTVRFTSVSDMGANANVICEGELPNAWYNYSNHSLAFCPSFYSYPSASIISTMGHEIGHAIDPCRFQCPLYEVHHAALDEAARTMVLTAEGERIYSIARSANITNYPFQVYLADHASLEAFVEAGAFTEIAPRQDFEDYPYLGVYQCLVRETPMRENTPEDFRKMAQDLVRYQNTQLGGLSGPTEEEIFESLSAVPQCVILADGSKSQMGEAMADVFGAEVAARYMRAHPPKTDMDRLAPLILDSLYICADTAQNNLSSSQLSSPYGIMVAANAVAPALRDPHPPGVERIDEIFFAHPEVRRSYNCEGNPSHSCLNPGATSSSPSPSTSSGGVQ